VNTQDRFPEFLEDQREFFDRLITDDWNTYLDSGWDDARGREVAAVMRVCDPRRVLDIGCGCGFHDVELARYPGVEHVVGIDYSEKSIETANREYPHPRVTRQVADARTFTGDPFDLIVSFQVVEHLSEPRELLAACARNARPGGVVAVVTPNRRRLDNRWQQLRGRPPQLIDPQHFREYAPSELASLANDLPLRHVRTIGIDARFVPPRLGRNVLPGRLARLLARAVPSLSSSYAVVWRRM
jgi:SAM-dependent methyltransferase